MKVEVISIVQCYISTRKAQSQEKINAKGYCQPLFVIIFGNYIKFFRVVYIMMMYPTFQILKYSIQQQHDENC